ncbi:hypothetical protein PR202_ga31040 [Eleusine coracana subsp. coracana]|uniref:Lipase-like protein n=1 Tax=Eleusine coracana subsp. coracana TaxID=191504 RepID=A0AAV5DP06_ELECO|nr:hypothetical protein PR202_ga31040 [Eleusine coracana subsp. coracana]
MEKQRKQGFFSALKGEVVRGLSPARHSRGKSPARMLLPRSRRTAADPSPEYVADPHVPHSGSLRPGGEVLAPLMEGPDTADGEIVGEESGRRDNGFGQWVRGHLSMAGSGGDGGSFRRSDLRLLLGVMGAPLAPVPASSGEPMPHLSVKSTPIVRIESSSAQYILQQYIAASGGAKLLRSVRNAYAMGKVRMVASEFETATRVVKNSGGGSGSGAAAVEQGGFVLWQMSPDMWYVELAIGGSKVRAGCDGRLVWRHTPWLGAHAAKGPVRPLRRALQVLSSYSTDDLGVTLAEISSQVPMKFATDRKQNKLQGLDPLTTAGLFAGARCVGEKTVGTEDCFILKLSADAETLRQRSEGPAEIVRHVLFGYFSQRTGLLAQIEDSHLTRIHAPAGDAVYWETTISSFLEDYRPVDDGGVVVAHAGRSAVTLFRFGEVAMSHTKTRMEEAWTIDEVAFDVPGLSTDCFIPPADIRRSGEPPCDLPPPRGNNNNNKVGAVHPARVAAVEKEHNADKIRWRMRT